MDEEKIPTCSNLTLTGHFYVLLNLFIFSDLILAANHLNNSSKSLPLLCCSPRVGRNIENFFRYYWTSVLEFFSVFNNIEISVLNIFNIQYYWTVLLRFSVIPKSRKSFKNPEKFPKKFFEKNFDFFDFFFFFNIKHFWYWIPKNTAKYRKIPKNTKKYQRILKILKKNITKQKNYSTKFSSSETSVFSVLIPKFRYYWTSILEFFQYSIILKFRYWTFSVFNIIEHRYFPVFSVFRDPDPHPTSSTVLHLVPDCLISFSSAHMSRKSKSLLTMMYFQIHGFS